MLVLSVLEVHDLRPTLSHHRATIVDYGCRDCLLIRPPETRLFLRPRLFRLGNRPGGHVVRNCSPLHFDVEIPPNAANQRI